MSDPIEFYQSFQTLLRGRAITGVLTSGMASVEYGIQQNTKDTDWIVAPDDIGSLVSLFGEIERGVSGGNWRVSYRGLFGAPLDAEYLDGGWTSHLAAFDHPESAERHLDFFGRPPRVGEAWRADAVAGIASRDIVARMKKTDRRGNVLAVRESRTVPRLPTGLERLLQGLAAGSSRRVADL